MLPEVARFCVREHVKPDDLAKAKARAGRVSEADWSAERDWRGQEVRLGPAWAQIGTATRLALAHQATRQGWTDQELVWSALYAARLQFAEERDQKEEYCNLLAGVWGPESWMSESAYYKDYEPAAAPQPQPAPPEPEPQPGARAGTPVPPVAEPVVPEPVPPAPQPNGTPQAGTPVPQAPQGVRGRTPAQQAAAGNIGRALEYALQIEVALQALLDAGGGLPDEGGVELDAEDAFRLQEWAEELELGAQVLGTLAGKVAGATEVAG